MGDPRIPLIYELFERCSQKYNDPGVCSMHICPHDEGAEHPGFIQYTNSYDSWIADRFPLVKRMSGPGYTANRWPTAGIDNFQEKIKKIIELADIPPTIPKVGWYGNIHSSVSSLPEKVTRPLMKEIGDKHPDLFEINHVLPDSQNFSTTSQNFVPIEKITEYSYVLDIGGQGFSGRTKYLLFTKRPLLYVDRRYREWFSDDLIPWTHYVPVKSDLRDLVQKAVWLKENPVEANRIAQNAFEFATEHFSEDKLLERVYEVYKTISNIS